MILTMAGPSRTRGDERALSRRKGTPPGCTSKRVVEAWSALINPALRMAT